MLRILGSPKRMCDGLSRRDLLQAGALGVFGLGLSDLLRLSAAQAATAPRALPRNFGRAKHCILLYLYGAPSQLETFDPKPKAPVEVRGELKSIPSSLPGLDVCELLPQLARVMDRTTVVRSLTHPYPIHGVAYALTGVPQIDISMELNPRDPRHWPFVGSVVEYLDARAREAAAQPLPPVPGNFALPFPFSSQRTGEVARAGPYAAFLGPAFNPIFTEFQGQGTRKAVRTLPGQRVETLDPYLGLTSDSHFQLSAGGRLTPELTIDRLDRRRSLLNQLDRARRDLERTPEGEGLDHFRRMAFSLIASERIRAALDLRREKPRTRESYGMTLFGQSALAARRLVEAGSRLVTVFWDEYGLAGSGWDTHWDHYPRMRNELLPGLDRALSGLILDLEARGMLDDTLVLCISEHGRTPRLQKVSGGGRDHWSRVYSALFAGGGMARGNVVGRSDKQAGDVADRPVSPKDILATLYHLLGIDPRTELIDRLGRPLPLVANGQVVAEMLA